MPDDKPREREPLPASGTFASSLTERAQDLRRQAHEKAAQFPQDLLDLSPEGARKLVHELRVHQIELELQNEELRQAQQELEASRSRYFDLYDLAPIGYLTIAEKGLVLEANLTAAGMLNVPRSALVMQPWTRFILPEDQDIYFKHRARLLATGSPQVCELRVSKAGGEAFWARLEARVVHDVDGKLTARTVLSDISERKCAEETLRSSEARHRALFENSPDALMTLAPPDWHFTSGNAATLRLFEARDEADFRSRALWDYSPSTQPDGGESREKALAALGQALKKDVTSFVWTCRRTSGQEFLATVVLARMQANGSTLLQATVRDDTQAQKEQGVLAHTERLASMGVLAASVGHEINNPLAYVLSNLETLSSILDTATELEPPLLGQAQEHARDALDGARRITRISRVLSTFSRVDSRELARVDLVHALEGALAMAFNELRFRAKLIKDLQAVPAVWASEGQLSQVFLNLLINASHAIPEGSVAEHSIEVRTWSEAGSVWAEVKDTGEGIAPANLARVFEPFFSTKRAGMGAGLGLSICRSIVLEFGGDIQVESQLGAGTRFLVRLPVVDDRLHPPNPEKIPDRPSLPLSHGRVLVIEDEQQLRTLLTRILADQQVVVAVESGEQALALLEQDQDFDLILCDLMMPGLTGVDVHTWLKVNNPALAAQVVFLTGGAVGRSVVDYLSTVGNLVLEKPFDKVALKRMVSERVGLRQSQRPASALRR